MHSASVHWFGRTLLALAGVASALLSITSCFIFLWGSPLSHPDPVGLLLCCGPALAFPCFLTLFLSFKLARRLMLVAALCSIAGSFIGFHIANPSASFTEAFRSPLVVAVLGINSMVEVAYWIDTREV